MAAVAATLVVSRGGSTVFEIASWQKPSIIIPITNSNENHQVKNAFAYAGAGGCTVLQEENLKPHVFLAEIKRIIESREIQQKMIEGSKSFFKPGAADTIAREIFSIVLSHEE
jgi:UDP-N-acetylglucosamine--N-acetylmuramyl-(pentapeptide) pyrophosphoryl-undecaprenol N-acetylglucosamine transferase